MCIRDSYHVHLERPGPVVGGRVQAHAKVDAGVGEVDIDAAEVAAGRVEKCAHTGLGGSVAGNRVAADLLRDRGGCLCVEVVDHNTGTLGGHPDRDGAADPVPGTGDNDTFALHVHVTHLR